jgi:integrase
MSAHRETAKCSYRSRDEVDLDEARWSIPASRMKKADGPHDVPLSDAAMAVLKERLATRSTSQLVFPSPMPLRDPSEPRRPLSNASLNNLMARLGVGEFSVHGRRAADAAIGRARRKSRVSWPSWHWPAASATSLSRLMRDRAWWREEGGS